MNDPWMLAFVIALLACSFVWLFWGILRLLYRQGKNHSV